MVTAGPGIGTYGSPDSLLPRFLAMAKDIPIRPRGSIRRPSSFGGVDIIRATYWENRGNSRSKRSTWCRGTTWPIRPSLHVFTLLSRLTPVAENGSIFAASDRAESEP